MENCPIIQGVGLVMRDNVFVSLHEMSNNFHAPLSGLSSSASML